MKLSEFLRFCFVKIKKKQLKGSFLRFSRPRINGIIKIFSIMHGPAETHNDTNSHSHNTRTNAI